MDIATVVGLFLGFALVIGSILIGGGGLGPFINVPSLMITVGGSFAALLINFPLAKVLGVASVVKKCFTVALPSTAEVIEQFMNLSTIVRRDGCSPWRTSSRTSTTTSSAVDWRWWLEAARRKS